MCGIPGGLELSGHRVAPAGLWSARNLGAASTATAGLPEWATLSGPSSNTS